VPRPPVITDNTPVGPDVDLDAEEIFLRDGTRLTSDKVPALVEEIRQEAEYESPADQIARDAFPEEQAEALVAFGRMIVRQAREERRKPAG
jgi:NaMN:DMB phosphoribosyltransferase